MALSTAFASGRTPSDVDYAALLPLFARKTTDESVTSSTTLQNDDALSVSVLASCTYEVKLFLVYDAATSGDLKFGFTGPAFATFDWVQGGLLNTADASFGSFAMDFKNATATAIVTGAGAGTKLIAMPEGLLVVSTTAGSFGLQWAQGTSSATATHVFAGSWMRLRRVA